MHTYIASMKLENWDATTNMVMETQSKQRIPIFAVAQAKLGFVQKGGGGRGATAYQSLSYCSILRQ